MSQRDRAAWELLQNQLRNRRNGSIASWLLQNQMHRFGFALIQYTSIRSYEEQPQRSTTVYVMQNVMIQTITFIDAESEHWMVKWNLISELTFDNLEVLLWSNSRYPYAFPRFSGKFQSITNIRTHVFREFTAAINFPCSKSWWELRKWRHFLKNTTGVGYNCFWRITKTVVHIVVQFSTLIVIVFLTIVIIVALTLKRIQSAQS